MTAPRGRAETVDAWRTWGSTRHVALGRAALAVGILAAWHGAARLWGPVYVPDLSTVSQWIGAATLTGELPRNVLVTLRLGAVGFAAGCSAGLVLPFLLYRLPRLMAAVHPYIMASAGVPKYALMPLFVLWLGIGDAPKLWLVGLLVFYPVFIGVSAGIREVDHHLVTMVRLLGATHVMAAREVIAYSILPFLFAALRIAVPRAISAAIIGEFLVGNEGLGYMIEHSRQSLDTAGVVGGLVAATALILTVNAGILRMNRRLTRWHPVDRQLQI